MKRLNSDYIKENGWLLSYWKEYNIYYIIVRTADNEETVIAKYNAKRDVLDTAYVLPLNVIDMIYKIVEEIEKGRRK